MQLDPNKQDLMLLLFLVLIIVGLPFGLWAYDRLQEPRNIRKGGQEFTLTGHAQKGWVLGEVKANDIVSLWQKEGPAEKPLIEVHRGDQVTLKLRSADVTHGFSLKAYGIYVTQGIQPGKTVYISFKADKIGRFVFMCTVFCGDIHKHMEGMLIVKDQASAPNA
jgi:heme/copper-type cytochrome/quinol oxidase subunit 2